MTEPTELEQLETLINADMATEAQKRRHAEIISGQAIAQAPPEPTLVPATGAEDATPFEDDVDAKGFKEGGVKWYMPSSEGFWKSALTSIIKPTFTDTAQRWFVFETCDDRLKSQGRGRIVVTTELEVGSGVLKSTLESIGIPFTVAEPVGGRQKVNYQVKFPHYCYADWSRPTSKDKTPDPVKVTGLRTLEAGAAVEKAV